MLSLWAFQEKLDGLGHFYTRYKNIDELKYHFNRQLDKLAASGFIDLKPEQAEFSGSGAVALGPDATAVGAAGVSVKGDSNGDINTGSQLIAQEGAQIIYAEQGATIVIGDAPVTMTAVDRQSALGRYLQHLISQNRYLQLQGIRSGGKLVNIELDRIYVSFMQSPLNKTTVV
jgi:hypothetical protein